MWAIRHGQPPGRYGYYAVPLHLSGLRSVLRWRETWRRNRLTRDTHARQGGFSTFCYAAIGQFHEIGDLRSTTELFPGGGIGIKCAVPGQLVLIGDTTYG
jgi:hypothetical protein